MMKNDYIIPDQYIDSFYTGSLEGQVKGFFKTLAVLP